MSKDYGQVALDCAVIRQALADIQTWNKPLQLDIRTEPEALTMFKGAMRWVFTDQHPRWHFSLAAICIRLDLPIVKVRMGVEARLTANQRAWMRELLRPMEAA
jgi:hypothetical protein